MKNIIKRLSLFVSAAIAMLLIAQPVFAGGIASSKLATGTEELIKDATTWLLVVAPLVTIVAVIYYCAPLIIA